MDDVDLRGPSWEAQDGVATRGSGLDNSGAEVHLQAWFADCETVADVVGTARSLEGFFAAVVDLGDAFALACDHARSIPLYFTTASPTRVSDVGTALPTGTPDPRFGPIAESEFLLTRYVTRGETLVPTIRSVRAGEVVRLPKDTPGEFTRHRYTRYRPTAVEEGDAGDFFENATEVLSRVFDRAAAVIGDRPAVVPLSGGWDSRLVATMLVERDCEVIGFTFGVPGHADVEVSRDVADALDIQWEHVRYTNDRWRDWYHSDAYRGYHEFAFGYDCLPFLAEWPAVRELRRDRRIPADAVVCPGHTVATPSERVPRDWVDAANPVSPDDVVDYILEEHYSLWEWDDPQARSVFAERIRADAGLGEVEGAGEAAAAYEEWEWTTRMATFTNNDTRVYDWFDLEWWLPLWDPLYVRFWADVPLEDRLGKALHREVAAKTYADITGLDPEAARRTDRDWTPADQVIRTLETDPLAALEGGFEDWLGAQAVPRSRWNEWGNYPLGWYGIIPEAAADLFDAAPNLYGLRTLEAVGRLDFDPPRIKDPPLTAEIELPFFEADGSEE